MVHLNNINMGISLIDNQNILTDLKFMIKNGFYTGMIYRLITTKISPSEMKKCIDLITRFPIILFCKHDINLCGTDKILAWNGNMEQNTKTKKLIQNLESHLEFMSCLEGGVVIDCGHFVLKKRGMNFANTTLEHLDIDKNQLLLLTNSNTKWSIVSSMEDLYRFWNLIQNHKNLGLAITIYDLSNITDIYNDYVRLFENIPPKLFIIEDKEWDTKKDSLYELLKIVYENNIYFIIK